MQAFLIVVGLFGLVCGNPAPFRDPMMDEGDIMGIDSDADRSTVFEEKKKWPGAIIPYVISPEQKSMEEIIFKAMDHISDHSCIRFVKRTTEEDYVKIVKGNECDSYAGRIGGEQEIRLAENCDHFLPIVRALMYAAGNNHEHMRPDRDEYVTVYYDNIRKAPVRDSMMNEGDIMELDSDADRSVVFEEEMRWPGAVIPYVISPELKPIEELIFKVMDHMSDHSCIRFVKRTTQKDYVKILKGDMCVSYNGRIGGEQELRLTDNSRFLNIICTLMYVVGINHEHIRPDRDEYVTVYYDNIIKGYEDQFEKEIPGEFEILTPFDEDSIMLFESSAFAKDPSKPTITLKDGRKILRDYDRQRMSIRDARQLNKLYNCPAEN